MALELKKLICGGLLTVTVLGVTGCGDKPEPVKPAPVQQAAPAAPPAPVSIGEPTVQTAVSAPPPGSSAALAMPPAGGAQVVASSGSDDVPSKDALDTVTKAVQSFCVAKERPPTSLEELVSSGFLRKLPAPPAGKKYVYVPSKLNISLADQ